MYIPEPFAFPEHATAELQDLVEAYNFGILIAPGGFWRRLICRSSSTAAAARSGP
jgi:hypothetical protein